MQFKTAGCYKEDIESPLAYTRLEDIRRSLRARGVAQEAIKTILSAWTDSTNGSYESAWKAWSDHCRRKGQDPCVANQPGLVAFVANCIGADNHKEGTVQKTTTIIRSTWDVINNPDAQLKKLAMTAAK